MQGSGMKGPINAFFLLNIHLTAAFLEHCVMKHCKRCEMHVQMSNMSM